MPTDQNASGKAMPRRVKPASGEAPDLPKVAFCYDFDGTLAPGNMQEHSFLPDVGREKSAFWREVNEIARAHEADNILIYMHEMLRAAQAAGIPVTRSDIAAHGAKVTLFDGVEGWFERVDAMGAALGLQIEHYIISSGIREMIAATAIGKHFKKIFASAFRYDAEERAIWPALAINYTTKTQYLFRINKDTLDVWDHSKINAFTERAARPVPFTRMVFFGDGETDVPCMRMLMEHQGYPVAVYEPGAERAKQNALKLIAQERARYAMPADYREGSALDTLTQAILRDIAAREVLAGFRT
ncbi:MAG: haloacid dehalogenase-like hydrolase [Neomegalonema sp.]|nr:haloacid dehalogenase-like hydrolase [Neomegalonema sp.]